jgi:tRNA(adenine34) deaminase
MKDSKERFMRVALAEARKGMNKGNRPFGAVIVKDGRIVARAHSTAISGHDISAHAELDVIRKLSNKAKTHDLTGCTLYATGQPCLMCSAAMAIAKISELVIGASHEDMPARMRLGRKRPGKVTYKEIFSEYGLKVKVNHGVLRDEVMKLYKERVKSQR